FVWRTDEANDALLACGAGDNPGVTPAPPTSVPVGTDAPTASGTTAAPVAAGTPTTPPVDAPTQPPTTAPPTDPGDTMSPTAEATTAAPVASPVTDPTSPPVSVPVQEACSANPECAAQDAIFSAGIESCCPAKDDQTLYLDCCAAVESFCTTPDGDLTVCKTISTSQYVGEVVTGQRDPSGEKPATDPPTFGPSAGYVVARILFSSIVVVIASMVFMG
ncbi:MAG: hypothetical protein SGARI_005551, partial [Bacillariaceae sp.]